MTSLNSHIEDTPKQPIKKSKYRYLTKIWREEPMHDNPFAAQKAYCYGYDVYDQILQKASWFEYVYLMYKGERPTPEQAALLEKLAIALANPGPREASVRAAMNGGVARAAHASSLMAALAVGAGQYGGSHEVYLLMQMWQELGMDLPRWQEALLAPPDDSQADIWRTMEHAPGFDPNGESCSEVLLANSQYFVFYQCGRRSHSLVICTSRSLRSNRGLPPFPNGHCRCCL